MIRLLRTEFARFWGRRIVWITAGIACVLIAIAFAITFRNSSSEAPDDSVAIAQADRARSDCVQYFTSLSADEAARDYPELEGLSGTELEDRVSSDYCYQDPAWYGDGDTRFFATRILVDDDYIAKSITDWSDFQTQRPSTITTDFGPGIGTVRLADDGLQGILPIVATFSLVLAVIIGASYVGAEYRAGTVENLLLWEPRRKRVLSAKLIGGFVSSTAVTVFVLSWLVALFFLLANLRGTTQGVDSQFWLDVASMTLRAGVIGGLFFVIAMSVAVIARNTTASVGIILGWFAVSNILIELAARGFRRWELFTNALAFINEADVPRYQRIRGEWSLLYSHSSVVGGLIVLVWATVFAAIATVVFSRRDIS